MNDFDLARFHSGDERFFNELVRTHSGRLLPVVRSFTHDAEEAHDLLQEVWLRAYQKRASFRGDGSLLGWLLAICRTTGLAAARKKRVTMQPLLGEDLVIHPAENLDQERRLLHEAIAALPPRQRDIVMLRIVEGNTTAEAARTLLCAEGTIKATLHQAVRKLQEQLAPKSEKSK